MKASDFPAILREFARMSFPSDSGRKDMPVSKGLARVHRLEAKMQKEIAAKQAKFEADKAAMEAESKPPLHATAPTSRKWQSLSAPILATLSSGRTRTAIAIAVVFIACCVGLFEVKKNTSFSDCNKVIVIKSITVPDHLVHSLNATINNNGNINTDFTLETAYHSVASYRWTVRSKNNLKDNTILIPSGEVVLDLRKLKDTIGSGITLPPPRLGLIVSTWNPLPKPTTIPKIRRGESAEPREDEFLIDLVPNKIAMTDATTTMTVTFGSGSDRTLVTLDVVNVGPLEDMQSIKRRLSNRL